ncbi:hypothetical protein O181_033119 [Austropuccinia psidii MF-1]|uniref:Uncharacterized protein n=1 Tax=Austropuccinia psidii MF-1 TaxID=1389203 RepID=A0A9Q3H879_9BASI|nr:hypothetical protein [Austropuccinia psidii MF-1]
MHAPLHEPFSNRPFVHVQVFPHFYHGAYNTGAKGYIDLSQPKIIKFCLMINSFKRSHHLRVIMPKVSQRTEAIKDLQLMWVITCIQVNQIQIASLLILDSDSSGSLNGR